MRYFRGALNLLDTANDVVISFQQKETCREFWLGACSSHVRVSLSCMFPESRRDPWVRLLPPCYRISVDFSITDVHPSVLYNSKIFLEENFPFLEVTEVEREEAFSTRKYSVLTISGDDYTLYAGLWLIVYQRLNQTHYFLEKDIYRYVTMEYLLDFPNYSEWYSRSDPRNHAIEWGKFKRGSIIRNVMFLTYGLGPIQVRRYIPSMSQMIYNF